MDNDLQLPKNYHKPLTAPAPSSAEGIGSQVWRAMDTARVYSWGWLPALSLTGAIGLLLVAVADTLSRSAAGQYELLFWAGLLLMIVPIAARLASSEPARRERIGLIILLGLGLYLAKVLHSPYGFTFSDELVHSYNGTRILETGRLFNANSILPVTPLYPGLETITAALASLSGLSIFGAGLVVVGIARLIAMLALFLFYEEVSGSSRLAGIAALLYATNANFLFWSAQFSYESLALPLAHVGVVCGGTASSDTQRCSSPRFDAGGAAGHYGGCDHASFDGVFPGGCSSACGHSGCCSCASRR